MRTGNFSYIMEDVAQRKNIKRKTKRMREGRSVAREPQLHPETKKNVWIIAFLGIAVIFLLAAAGQAGPVGGAFYRFLTILFGWGYYLFPAVLFLLALALINVKQQMWVRITIIGAFMFIVSSLGFIDLLSSGNGGITGSLVGALEIPFGMTAALVITLTVLIISFLVTINRPLRLTRITDHLRSSRADEEEISVREPEYSPADETADDVVVDKEPEEEQVVKIAETKPKDDIASAFSIRRKATGDYTPPPLSLFTAKTEKPTSGDLKANSNIIRRTFESFGIHVEMDEVQIGPTVTRYTLKPAEGVKLTRITALNQDLALALATHPIRIEAPIPGKSLVGIEVPNKTAALVRLGSLLAYPEFQKSGPLVFSLGRGVNGDPVFADVAKMPHLLIAGSTGSGKSITIHALLMSLLYKNASTELRLILIDPKRVELSVYEGIPHLVTPVITENKKALGALKWAINEMENRYELLLSAGVRDIKSYNSKSGEPLPYLIIVIDELADLMASYGREVEGAIVRLAQMSRAVGIHLIVSTQRPSVEVITGLIKANITSRIALQVASQIDSRTILDTAGAEKLLGNGDMLFISSESSKPIRIQGAYITDDEVRDIVAFITKHNEAQDSDDVNLETQERGNLPTIMFEDYDDNGDELYDDALEVVRKARKASASLLQRRLRVGYARAARLLDIMEERGMVGPADGAKPREVYIVKDENEAA